MNKTRKLLTSICALGLIALTGCEAQKAITIDLLSKAPDYTRKKGEFMTFGYTPPTNGKWYENGLEMTTGEDYRTVERYREYKEAGLNVLMLQSEDAYDYGTPFEDSLLKVRMDDAQEAGLDKVIVCDNRLYNLCNSDQPVVGDDGVELTINGKNFQGGIKQFKTQEALNNYVADILSAYYYHDVFYGVLLRDEPFHQHLLNYGYTYQAVKAFDDDIYIEGNLNPYSSDVKNLSRYTDDDSLTPEEAYESYVNYYLDCSGAEKVLMDSYPFLGEYPSPYMKNDHLKGCQMIADICKKRGVKFEAVAQTFGGTSSGKRLWSAPDAATMQWQLNTYMGFGIQTFGYFTYWRKVWNNNQAGGEWFNDGESFITTDGQKTSLYYIMQGLHKEMQKFAPVISSFKYSASKTYAHEPCLYPTNYLRIKDEKLALVKNFECDEGDAALITELKDKSKMQYMYMVMNAMNPQYKVDDTDIVMNYSIDFGPNFNAVEVYYRGNRACYPLENGVYKSTLDAGYAEYLMPYKA